ncbi:MAG: hypothetical protein GDA36_07585 [Rhodobacteraceae bacterium]|nr:hypothetical protein [Paracoccaceae bacterium]
MPGAPGQIVHYVKSSSAGNRVIVSGVFGLKCVCRYWPAFRAGLQTGTPGKRLSGEQMCTINKDGKFLVPLTLLAQRA